MAVTAGDPAPSFSLAGTHDGVRRTYSLEEFAGRPVVLIFYPGDNTPVCTRQLNSYTDDIDQFIALDAQLLAMREQAEGLGMTALVEVHDADETRRAVAAGARVIGVNARNLKTLEVDPAVFARLRPLIPDAAVAVAESGIRGVADVARYAAEGARAVLVGEALVIGGDPEGTVARFAEVPVGGIPDGAQATPTQESAMQVSTMQASTTEGRR